MCGNAFSFLFLFKFAFFFFLCQLSHARCSLAVGVVVISPCASFVVVVGVLGGPCFQLPLPFSLWRTLRQTPKNTDREGEREKRNKVK